MQGRTPPNIVAIFETCHPQPLDNAQVELATLVFFFTESETNESYMPAILDTKSKFMLERHTLPHAPLDWWIFAVFAEIKRIRCSPRRHPQRVHKQGAFRGQQFHRCGRADRSRSSANFKSGSAAPEGGGRADGGGGAGGREGSSAGEGRRADGGDCAGGGGGGSAGEGGRADGRGRMGGGSGLSSPFQDTEQSLPGHCARAR